MATFTANAAVLAGLNAVLALIDSAGVGQLVIYDDPLPADADAAPSTVVRATLPLNATAFGPAVDANPGASAPGNAIATVAANEVAGTGPCTHFRLNTGGGTCIIQGATGLNPPGTAEMILNTLTITDGVDVTINSMTATMAEQV